jgi:hypothetical protein
MAGQFRRLRYEPLKQKDGKPSIRMLTLEPGYGHYDELLCHLSTHFLEECPAYEALSYCWGDPGNPLSIICNDSTLPVGRNLYSALQHLRLGNEPRMLWIDAICINQDDLEERGNQVRIMSELYQRAERVVCWLGEDAEDSELVFPLCTRLIEEHSGELHKMDILSMVRYPRLYGFRTSTTREEILAAHKISKRPNFERAWVIQELMVASKVVVACGDADIDWDTFCFGFLLAVCLGKNFSLSGTPMHLQGIIKTMEKRAQRWSGEGKWRNFDILSLLNYFMPFKATDPRDKVYALLSLTTTDLTALDVHPDYNKEVTACYIQISKSILSSYNNLDLFSTPRTITELSHTLPSWASNWSGEYKTPISHLNLDGRSFTPNTPTFNATKNSSLSGSLLFPNATTVRLHGHVIDRIHILEGKIEVTNSNYDTVQSSMTSLSSYLGSVSDILQKATAIFDTLLKWDDLALGMQSNPYPTGEDHMTVYCSTISDGHALDGAEEAMEVFAKRRSLLRGPRGLQTARLNKFRGFYEWAAVPAGILFSSSGRGISAVSEVALYRRLARTEKGYLALVPAEARIDDKIALLQGGKVPYVVREKGKEWELIGDCYVHGIMFGEMWNIDQCVEMDFV